MSDRNVSCESRIDGELKDRLETIADILDRYAQEDEETSEAAREELYELPLSVETVRQVRIVLSTGGPHDEFLFTLGSDGSIVRTEYVFTDWFDGARRVVTRDVDPSEVADQFGNYFAEIVNWEE